MAEISVIMRGGPRDGEIWVWMNRAPRVLHGIDGRDLVRLGSYVLTEDLSPEAPYVAQWEPDRG